MQIVKKLALAVLTACWLTACSRPTPPPDFPLAESRPVILTLHGDTRTDPYHYLANPEDPATRRYIEAEQAYLQRQAPGLTGCQQAYIAAINRVLPNALTGTPVYSSGYWYERQVRAGAQYPIFVRRAEATGEIETLLDLNQFSDGAGYLVPGDFEVRGDLIAFTLDNNGDEIYTLRVQELSSGKELLHVEQVGPTLAFSGDASQVYFLNPGRDTVKVTDVIEGEVVVSYREPDAAFKLSLRSEATQVLLNSESHNGNEIRRLDVADDVQMLAPRQPGVTYRLRLMADEMVVLTNVHSADFGLAVAEPGSPVAEWLFIKPGIDGVIRDFEPLDDEDSGFALHVNSGLTESIVRLNRHGDHETLFSTSQGELRLSSAPAGHVRFSYSNPVTPRREYQLTSGQLLTDSGNLQSPYTIERRWLGDDPGAAVPVTLIRSSGSHTTDQAPLLVTTYGAYGLRSAMGFDPTLIPYLEQGLVIAMVHVRGSGDLDSAWREAGRGANKPAAFRDFQYALSMLAQEPGIDADRIMAWGRSAGATLVGLAAADVPERLAGVILEVPFLDLLTTLSHDNDSLALTDLSEWGDPQDLQTYRQMLSFSPYDQLKSVELPAMLVRIDMDDTRVGFHEGLKWMAKSRAIVADLAVAKPPLMLMDIGEAAGHRGPTDQLQRRKQEALNYAFVMSVVNKR